MAAVIYQGDIVKALKDGIKLGDGATILSGSLDPSSTPVSAAVGDVYISTSTGKIYVKSDSGLSTSWDQTTTVADLAFVDIFDNTADWGTAAGGYYTITITQATHQKGTNPIVQVFETNGSSDELINTDLISVNTDGDVSFRVNETPNLRFSGKVVIK